eukprot:Nk52_evm27s1763 gene=Nk52_evmTU27s1763
MSNFNSNLEVSEKMISKLSGMGMFVRRLRRTWTRQCRLCFVVLLFFCCLTGWLMFLSNKQASPTNPWNLISSWSVSPDRPVINQLTEERVKALAAQTFSQMINIGQAGSGGCEQSMMDSDGKFCYPDSTWNRVKKIARRQRILNYFPNKDFQFSDAFIYLSWAWEPEMSCLEEIRLGRIADGGKWLCDPDRLIGDIKENCLIYSLGSNNEYEFEMHVHHLYPQCEIHTFDHTVANPTPPDFVGNHKWGVGATDGPFTAEGQPIDGNVYTFETLQRVLGHTGRRMAVLKMDVEGAEYGMFDKYFVDGPNAPVLNFDQILIETHTGNSPPDYKKTHDLILNLVRYGNYGTLSILLL